MKNEPDAEGFLHEITNSMLDKRFLNKLIINILRPLWISNNDSKNSRNN